MTWEDLRLICLKRKGEGRNKEGPTLRFAPIVHLPVNLTVNGLERAEGVLNAGDFNTKFR